MNMQKTHVPSSFTRRVFSSMVTHGVGILLGFASAIVLARVLGAEARGVVFWIVSLHVIGATLVQLNLSKINQRFAAENPALSGVLFRLTLWVVVLAGVVLLPLLYWWGSGQEVGAAEPMALAVGIGAVLFLGWADALGSLLVGLHHSRGYNRINIAQKVFVVAATVLLAVAGQLTIFTAVLAIALGCVVKCGLAVYFLRPHVREGQDITVRAVLRQLRGTMLYNYLASLSLLVLAQGSLLLLGLFGTAEQVGWLGVAFTLIDAVFMLPRMVAMYALPHLAETPDRAVRLKRRVQVLLLLFGALLGTAGVLWLIAPWLIPFLFGEEFAPAVGVFRVLLIGLITGGMGLLLHYIIAAEARNFHLAWPQLLAALVFIMAAYRYFEEGGALVAAWVWSGSHSVAMILSVLALWRVLAVKRQEVA